MASDFRVLSIQSHVVCGYVGNKSACFPLQILGFDVDAINSVQFSNHTGYPHIRGQVLNEKELSELIDGLRLNGMLRYTHLLTGYCGSASFLTQVLQVIRELKKLNPNLVYVCDPVMGDNGKMYVPEELLPIYRDQLIVHADVLTPNQYEAELLSGTTIDSQDSAFAAMDVLHERGVPTVVITSSQLGNSKVLVALASSTVTGGKCRIKVEMPKMAATFTGTGDLFAALLLAWLAKTNNDLKVSCEKTINTMQSVLRRTLDYAASERGADRGSAQTELRLIQSKSDFEQPSDTIRAQILSSL